MKYNEVIFKIKPLNEDFSDMLAGLLGEIGFETFVPSTEGLKAYIQQDLFSCDVLEECIANYPIPSVEILYSVEEAPDENWNQTWEEEGFKPIVIGKDIAVHTTKHTDIPKVTFDILIHPCQAFGTGSHQTTRLILSTLKDMNLFHKFVVDAGTGTGILSIMAVKCGAEKVLAYDIDEWSVKNALSNAELNHVEKQVDVLLGCADVLNDTNGVDLLIANINRNILMNDLPAFRKTLNPKGQIILSGFYTEDVPLLEEKAAQLGLVRIAIKEEDGWAMLLFEADATSGMDV